VCFGRVWADDVTLDIVDRSGRQIGGYVYVWDGWDGYTRSFCGRERVRMQPGDSVTVFIDGPGDVRGANAGPGLWDRQYAPGCAELQPVPGVRATRGATRGFVRATFTRRLQY
jgi:hypothetical protein